MIAAIVEFIRGWSTDDVYDRFGTLGSNGPSWLAEGLIKGERAALIVREEDRIVGLLDYVQADCTVHFGIVVDRARRRQHIGRHLVEALLERSASVIEAECRFDNAGAVALLRSCGFTRYRTEHGESLWRR